ncbi:MAG: ADP-glyceromanno-heptose 6-epimerase [Candidatus Andersenbacteria bacterium]
MIIITGAAGFIGSALLWALNERGETDILLVDELDHDDKERNLAPLKYEELVGIKEFREKLLAGDYNNRDVKAIFHLGACSDTTETNWAYLEDNNVEYSKDIIRWCTDRDIRCIYASSGATYGSGEQGYSDDHKLFNELKPLNLYGKSKLLVDIWALDGGYLDKAVGLRYFNVFGPNEWHKGHMQSVIAKRYPEVVNEGVMHLFKSYHPDYGDGEQQRDFVYVKDAVAATLFFYDNPKPAGVFNVGTGKASTWNEVAYALFAAADKTPRIEYIEMPKNIRDQYQYFTEADIKKLTSAGFTKKPYSLPDAVGEYVQDFLAPNKHLGE